MAELLIRVHDSPLIGDPLFDSKASRRGDVIVAMPDGWGWGDKELSLPFWRIVKLPNVSLAAGQSLCAGEVDVDPLNPSPTLQFRAFTFNVTDARLPAPALAYLADDTRVQPFFRTTVITDVTIFRVQKQPISVVVGTPTTVIG